MAAFKMGGHNAAIFRIPNCQLGEAPGPCTLKRQILFYGFQLMAIAWAGVVLLRTVTLGWGPFASMGLAVAGGLPISFLGIRMNSKQKKKEKTITTSQL